MAIDEEDFRAALRRWASGVTVVTTKDRAGHLHGITVSAFSSLSLTPPLVLICIDKNTGSHEAFEESEGFVVNILSEGQQLVSQQFASKIPDKFQSIEFTSNNRGIPVLTDALASLECRRVSSVPGGDHTIFIGEVEKTTVFSDHKPLLYYRGSYGTLTD